MIIAAKKEHLEDVYALICELEQDWINKERFIQCYQESLENKNVYYYVYQHQQKIVGFISLYVHHYLHHHHDTGEIVEFVVSCDYRSMKIGDQLIRWIENKAKELNLEEIELSTSTYRKKAHRFYEAHGYEKNHYNYTKNIK